MSNSVGNGIGLDQTFVPIGPSNTKAKRPLFGDGFKSAAREFLRSFGLDVRRFNPDNEVQYRRARILETQDITLVLDVGANVGGYGQEIRRAGYTGKIMSFEPQSRAYAALREQVQADPLWAAYRCALGPEPGETEINIAANSVSSSILPMHDNHVQAAPESKYVDKEVVVVKRLDRDLVGPLDSERVFLKLDVQGYESAVLAGASDILPHVKVIEIELSFVPLYAGHPSFRQMIDFLDDAGFALVSTERGLTNTQNGQILQIDGIFLRQP